MRIYKFPIIFAMILFLFLGLIGCSEEAGDTEEQYYTITTIINSGTGTIALTPDQNEYKAGTEVTIQAVPDTNFLFDCWTGSLSSTQQEQVITVDSDLTIFASFIEGIASLDITTNITSDNVINSNFPLTLTADINNPNGDLSEVIINWGDSQTDTITSNYNNINLDHTYSNQQEYTVTVTGVNSNGEDIESITEVDVTVINFIDTNLEQVVRNKISKDTKEITELNCHNRAINDLGGIEYLTELTDLALGENDISDISLLSNLINLKTLSLTKTNVTDISPLANLTNLETLRFNYTNVTDLSALSNLTNLEELFARKNPEHSAIEDISSLGNLTELTTLDLSRSNITYITSLASLDKLESVYLSTNNVSDLSPLADLTSLVTLYLDYNDISELPSLSGLTNLNSLDLSYNNIIDISPLENLTGLSSLDLENNSLDTSPGSDDMSIITHLENNGVSVEY